MSLFRRAMPTNLGTETSDIKQLLPRGRVLGSLKSQVVRTPVPKCVSKAIEDQYAIKLIEHENIRI